MHLTRREILAGAAALTLRTVRADEPASAQAMAAVLGNIHAPEFPKRTFEVTHYGATSGGSADCTAAIRQAVEACSAAGGGVVIMPRCDSIRGRFADTGETACTLVTLRKLGDTQETKLESFPKLDVAGSLAHACWDRRPSPVDSC